MSDEKPFAWCRQVGEEVCIEADDGFVVARFALDVSSQSEYTKDALNSAVAARKRKAAAKALREAADQMPIGLICDQYAVKDWLNSRADAIEGGAT